MSSPKCRGEYAPSEQPQRYFCFCGKEENPKYDIWTVPHSCGKTCDKLLKPDCSHTCSLLCHPGMFFANFKVLMRIFIWIYVKIPFCSDACKKVVVVS